MDFELVGPISEVEVIASGASVRVRKSLEEQYGSGRWRKLKGVALIRLVSKRIRRAELHWYEAHGIGRRRLKIKRFLDESVPRGAG